MGLHYLHLHHLWHFGAHRLRPASRIDDHTRPRRATQVKRLPQVPATHTCLGDCGRDRRGAQQGRAAWSPAAGGARAVWLPTQEEALAAGQQVDKMAAVVQHVQVGEPFILLSYHTSLSVRFALYLEPLQRTDGILTMGCRGPQEVLHDRDYVQCPRDGAYDCECLGVPEAIYRRDGFGKPVYSHLDQE